MFFDVVVVAFFLSSTQLLPERPSCRFDDNDDRGAPMPMPSMPSMPSMLLKQ
jgi:hypothetical protein